MAYPRPCWQTATGPLLLTCWIVIVPGVIVSAHWDTSFGRNVSYALSKPIAAAFCTASLRDETPSLR